VVFETIDSRVDLTKAAAKAGIEILLEAEEETEPSDTFPRVNKAGDLTGGTGPVPSCLHALCTTQEQATTLVNLWKSWVQEGAVKRGFGPFKELFSHLRDVRAWGPQDRLRMAGVAERLAGLLDDQSVGVEVELWFRLGEAARSSAARRVTQLVTEQGGQVSATATITEVGYHAVAADIPVSTLRQLASGQYDDVALVRSSDVMYFRVTGQAVTPIPIGEAENLAQRSLPAPSGDPVLAILDGVPIANHDLLRDRVVLHDPDGLESDPQYLPERRLHGTAMASIAIWGDLNEANDPLARPVVLRPVLRPDAHSGSEVIDAALVPDLMRRAFAELFGTPQTPGAAPTVQIVNVSLGDRAMPFDVIPSAWARTLDWLSAEYGVLIVVSAGNHPTLPVPGLSGSELTRLTKRKRAQSISEAVSADAMNRRLLSPAEALNALTVGAIHEDGTASFQIGNRFDPSDGERVMSPVSAIGRGFKRSVKPELAAAGGRQFFRDPFLGGDPLVLRPAPATRGPGLKVAAWSPTDPNSGTSFVVGTSPAAALVSRRAAQLTDALIAQTQPSQGMSRSQISCAIKALLVHEARWPEDIEVGQIPADRLMGYGTRELDLVRGCEPHEVTLLFAGELHGQQQIDLSVPLPDGLQVRGAKRVAATVAWLSPVNWRHRQYRRAKLQFAKPAGFVSAPNLATRDVSYALAGRGTVEQQVYETDRASSAGQGDSMNLTVKCEEQAGGLNGEPVPYAAVVSLWVAPELGVDVYDQVRQGIAATSRVQPTV
jgi:hypothetical protein